MDRAEILSKLANGGLSVEEANRMLEELAASPPPLYCKVSQKGAVSVYGLQRMPVTLYADQWERLLNFAEQIREFIAQHESELKRKTAGGETETPPQT